MESLDRDLTTLEIPHHNMNFDSHAGNFFITATVNGGTTSSDLEPHHHPKQRSATIGNQFLQKLGETLFGFGGKSDLPPAGYRVGVSGKDIAINSNMDLLRNHIVIDSGDFNAVDTSAASELQQQMEYDKFMNEIWIGIVLTLIIISMVFCICSCFLYHQFRQWKRNYRHNLQQSQDIESVKLNPDSDDPVPEYTLVSGLPTYEAALELMQNKARTLLPGGSDNTSSCLIVYPSLFNVFTMNEKDSCVKSFTLSQSTAAATTTTTAVETTTPQSPSICGAITSTTTIPAIATATAATTTTTTTPIVSQNVKCQNVPRLALHSIPSYEEATSRQPQQHQAGDTSICLMKSPSWCGVDASKVSLLEEKN